MKKLLSFMLVICLTVIPTLAMAEIDQVASEQLHTMQKLVRETDNITTAGTYEVSYMIGDEKGSLSYSDLCVNFHDPLIVHITEYPSAADQAPTELYIVQQGDKVVIYASDENRESDLPHYKEIERTEMVAETMGELDSVTHHIDSMVSAKLSGDATITVNGVDYDCVRIDIMAHVLDIIDEMVHNTLNINPAYDINWTNDIEIALADLLIPLSYWIDKETGMLVQFSSDVTEVMKGIYDFIPNEYDGGFYISDCKTTYQVTGVNDAEEICIPAKYIAYNEH